MKNFIMEALDTVQPTVDSSKLSLDASDTVAIYGKPNINKTPDAPKISESTEVRGEYNKSNLDKPKYKAPPIQGDTSKFGMHKNSRSSTNFESKFKVTEASITNLVNLEVDNIKYESPFSYNIGDRVNIKSILLSEFKENPGNHIETTIKKILDIYKDNPMQKVTLHISDKNKFIESANRLVENLHSGNFTEQIYLSNKINMSRIAQDILLSKANLAITGDYEVDMSRLSESPVVNEMIHDSNFMESLKKEVQSQILVSEATKVLLSEPNFTNLNNIKNSTYSLNTYIKTLNAYAEGKPKSEIIKIINNGVDFKGKIPITDSVMAMLMGTPSEELTNKLESVDINKFETSNISNVNSNELTNKLESIDINKFETSNISNVNSNELTNKLESVDINKFETSNISNGDIVKAESIILTESDKVNIHGDNFTNEIDLAPDNEISEIRNSNENFSNLSELDSMPIEKEKIVESDQLIKFNGINNVATSFGISQIIGENVPKGSEDFTDTLSYHPNGITTDKDTIVDKLELAEVTKFNQETSRVRDKIVTDVRSPELKSQAKDIVSKSRVTSNLIGNDSKKVTNIKDSTIDEAINSNYNSHSDLNNIKIENSDRFNYNFNGKTSLSEIKPSEFSDGVIVTPSELTSVQYDLKYIDTPENNIHFSNLENFEDIEIDLKKVNFPSIAEYAVGTKFTQYNEEIFNVNNKIETQPLIKINGDLPTTANAYIEPELDSFGETLKSRFESAADRLKSDIKNAVNLKKDIENVGAATLLEAQNLLIDTMESIMGGVDSIVNQVHKEINKTLSNFTSNAVAAASAFINASIKRMRDKALGVVSDLGTKLRTNTIGKLTGFNTVEMVKDPTKDETVTEALIRRAKLLRGDTSAGNSVRAAATPYTLPSSTDPRLWLTGEHRELYSTNLTKNTASKFVDDQLNLNLLDLNDKVITSVNNYFTYTRSVHGSSTRRDAIVGSEFEGRSNYYWDIYVTSYGSDWVPKFPFPALIQSYDLTGATGRQIQVHGISESTVSFSGAYGGANYNQLILTIPESNSMQVDMYLRQYYNAIYFPNMNHDLFTGSGNNVEIFSNSGEDSRNREYDYLEYGKLSAAMNSINMLPIRDQVTEFTLYLCRSDLYKIRYIKLACVPTFSGFNYNGVGTQTTESKTLTYNVIGHTESDANWASGLMIGYNARGKSDDQSDANIAGRLANINRKFTESSFAQTITEYNDNNIIKEEVKTDTDITSGSAGVLDKAQKVINNIFKISN